MNALRREAESKLRQYAAAQGGYEVPEGDALHHRTRTGAHMTKYRTTVTVDTDTPEHAELVLTERLSYDELYDDEAGEQFDYTVDWLRVQTPPPGVRQHRIMVVVEGVIPDDPDERKRWDDTHDILRTAIFHVCHDNLGHWSDVVVDVGI